TAASKNSNDLSDSPTKLSKNKTNASAFETSATRPQQRAMLATAAGVSTLQGKKPQEFFAVKLKSINLATPNVCDRRRLVPASPRRAKNLLTSPTLRVSCPSGWTSWSLRSRVGEYTIG